MTDKKPLLKVRPFFHPDLEGWIMRVWTPDDNIVCIWGYGPKATSDEAISAYRKQIMKVFTGFRVRLMKPHADSRKRAQNKEVP